MIPGKIIIKDKVYFEPEGLEKPDKNHVKYSPRIIRDLQYSIDLKAYEASKQLIEVEKVNYSPLSQSWILEPFDLLDFSLDPNRYVIINNQPCIAKIKDNKATIIELTKE